jgi:hypothetical protein
MGCVPVIRAKLTEALPGVAAVDMTVIRHCMKARDWNPEKKRFNQREACDYAIG